MLVVLDPAPSLLLLIIRLLQHLRHPAALALVLVATCRTCNKTVTLWPVAEGDNATALMLLRRLAEGSPMHGTVVVVVVEEEEEVEVVMQPLCTPTPLLLHLLVGVAMHMPLLHTAAAVFTNSTERAVAVEDRILGA